MSTLPPADTTVQPPENSSAPPSQPVTASDAMAVTAHWDSDEMQELLRAPDELSRAKEALDKLGLGLILVCLTKAWVHVPAWLKHRAERSGGTASELAQATGWSARLAMAIPEALVFEVLTYHRNRKMLPSATPASEAPPAVASAATVPAAVSPLTGDGTASTSNAPIAEVSTDAPSLAQTAKALSAELASSLPLGTPPGTLNAVGVPLPPRVQWTATPVLVVVGADASAATTAANAVVRGAVRAVNFNDVARNFVDAADAWIPALTVGVTSARPIIVSHPPPTDALLAGVKVVLVTSSTEPATWATPWIESSTRRNAPIVYSKNTHSAVTENQP